MNTCCVIAGQMLGHLQLLQDSRGLKGIAANLFCSCFAATLALALKLTKICPTSVFEIFLIC